MIKNSLHKLYLEDFYRVCQAIGGETAVFMGHLIKLRADRMAINITVNRYVCCLPFLPPPLPPLLVVCVCQAIGGETAKFMGHLIKLRADRIAINITVNRYVRTPPFFSFGLVSFARPGAA